MRQLKEYFNMNIISCTDEKTRFLIDTMKAMIIVKNHFRNNSCYELNDFFLKTK